MNITGLPAGEYAETTNPDVPSSRAQWRTLVIRVTGENASASGWIPAWISFPLASSPRPPPGTWSGKTSIPSMPCSACACVLKRTRQGAGGFEALKPAVRAAGGLMDTGVRLLVPGGCAGWKAWGRVGGSGGPPSGASAPSVCGGALSGALDLGALGWMSYLHWFLEKVV